MGNVKIKLFGPFREVTGTKEIVVKTTEKSKVKDVLDFLVEKYGGLMRKILFEAETNTLRDIYQILLNGRNIYSLKGVETQVKDMDEITIYPPVAGG